MLIARTKFCTDTGCSSVTAWRWEKAGLLPPIRIAGKTYYRDSDVERFANRASRGEFASPLAGCVAAAQERRLRREARNNSKA